MKRLIYFSNWLYLFSLSLWVGGMFLLGNRGSHQTQRAKTAGE
jgi:hypothetical protein